MTARASYVGPTALLVVAVISGCGSAGCDSIGLSFSVRVALPTPEWRIEEFCVEDECVDDGIGDPRYDPHTITVANERNPRPYRLRVVTPQGRTVVDEGNLDARDFRGTGSGCPPEVTTAVIRVTEAGAVTLRSG